MKLRKVNKTNVISLADARERKESELKAKIDALKLTPEELGIELLKPNTLEYLQEESHKIKNNSFDFMVKDSSDIRMDETGQLRFINTINNKPQLKVLDCSRWSMGQLCSKIGVPARYIEKCLVFNHTELAAHNMNTWLQSYDKPLFIREYNDRVRGVLSDRYSVCDSDVIMDILCNNIDSNMFNVKGSFLNEERLHCRLIMNEDLGVKGEDLFAGLFIDSSDVGRSTLVVQFGVWKQVCSNGLMIIKHGGTLFRQKHIGIKSDEFENGLIVAIKAIPEMCQKTVEWINEARNKKADLGADFEKMTNETREKIIDRIYNQTKLSDESVDKVIDLMSNRYGGTQWGYVNAITEVAQEFTLERRLELERIAGGLLVA